MAKFDDFARLEFEGWTDAATARSYATDFATAAEQCVPTFVTAVRAGPGIRALDLCCGHGIVANGLAQSGADTVGLDFSPAMLDMARCNVSGVKFIEGNAMALEFGDNTFDAVTIGFGIPHVRDAKKVFSEVKRILRPGGRFAYSVWHGAEKSGAMKIAFEAIKEHGDPAVALPPGPDAHTFADKKIAFAALEEAGFSECALKTVECYWLVNDACAVFNYFRDGTVRGSALLRTQPQMNLTQIRKAIRDAVQKEFGSESPWQIPVPAVVVSATS